jgi:hypothetical protein
MSEFKLIVPFKEYEQKAFEYIHDLIYRQI